MEKIKRNERLVIMTKMFLDEPNVLFTLNTFSEKFGIAKTTLSEDVLFIREMFEKYEFGKLEAVAGAGGGVKYIPFVNKEKAYEDIMEICEILSSDERKLDGGFMFINDILSNPLYVNKMADVFVSLYSKTNPDYVVTMSAKGIPLASAVATKLSKQLVVINREKKVTDGTCVSIHYFPYGRGEGREMVVSKRMLETGKRAIIIDDFMRNGGTIKGICDIMKEFAITVVGVGVAISTKQPNRKVVADYKELMVMDNSQFAQNLVISPAEWLKTI